MKQIYLIATFCFATLFAYGQDLVGEVGQDSAIILFDVQMSKTSQLTDQQKLLLKTKVEAAVARTNMVGNGKSLYVIVPSVSVTDVKTTDNSIIPTTIVSGELTLLVKNRIDGKAYNELTIPLKVSQPITSKEDNTSLLIETISIRDKRFVRFIKVSRNRIADSKNPK